MRKMYQYALFLTLIAAMLLLPSLATADGETATITGNMVNMRSGPGLQYERVTYLYKGNTVTVTGKPSEWYAVTYNGMTGYVYEAYLKLDESSATPAPTATPTPDSYGGGDSSATLRYGSRGDAVKQLQGNLIMLGYLNGRADGIFGAMTQTAVKKYQSRNGLPADGVAGRATNAAIGAEVLRILSVVNTAKKYLGLAYQYGGTSPSTGFDCSGLTQYAFAKAGISIPRVSYEQASAGVSVPRSQIRVGDLVAFHSPISHVGIYIGNGQFIHSPKTGDVIKITNLSAMNLTAIRRFTGVLAS